MRGLKLVYNLGVVKGGKRKWNNYSLLQMFSLCRSQGTFVTTIYALSTRI